MLSRCLEGATVVLAGLLVSCAEDSQVIGDEMGAGGTGGTASGSVGSEGGSSDGGETGGEGGVTTEGTAGGGNNATGGTGDAGTGGKGDSGTGGTRDEGTGGTGGDAAGGMGGTATGGGSAPGGTGGQAGASGSGGEAGQGSTECTVLSQSIADEIGTATTCTAVVRLDYESYEIIGFQIVCGVYTEVDETTARQTAEDETGYGLDGTLLTGPDPQDEFVFLEPAGDFGGVGVVSAHSGAAVFGGGIVWDGKGDITYPAAWKPSADIGPDCIPPDLGMPTPRAFDLSGGEGAMAQSQIEVAMSRVWNTALPDGLSQRVLNAMVLLYAPSVGVVNLAVAEWIVLVNSGQARCPVDVPEDGSACPGDVYCEYDIEGECPQTCDAFVEATCERGQWVLAGDTCGC